MKKSKQKTKTKKRTSAEQDSTYFLKLVLYMMAGSLWIKVTNDNAVQWPIPIGLIVGLLFIQHEHFKIDRKIEYAILLLAMFVGFWLPIGIYISL